MNLKEELLKEFEEFFRNLKVVSISDTLHEILEIDTEVFFPPESKVWYTESNFSVSINLELNGYRKNISEDVDLEIFHQSNPILEQSYVHVSDLDFHKKGKNISWRDRFHNIVRDHWKAECAKFEEKPIVDFENSLIFFMQRTRNEFHNSLLNSAVYGRIEKLINDAFHQYVTSPEFIRKINLWHERRNEKIRRLIQYSINFGLRSGLSLSDMDKMIQELSITQVMEV